MRRPALLILIAVLCLILAGRESVGRLALMLHAPLVAEHLLTDPAEKGVAYFSSQHYEKADKAFEDSGRTQTFNRGLSLAAIGKYDLSLAYFDAVLFANPSDSKAREMRNLVAQMVTPVRGEGGVKGRLNAKGGMETDAAISQSQYSTPDPEWQKQTDAKGIAASDDWLFSVNDDPGTYLKLRLQAEFERREAEGLIRPSEGSPW